MNRPLWGLLFCMQLLMSCKPSTSTEPSLKPNWLVTLDSLNNVALPLPKHMEALRSQGYHLYYNGNHLGASEYFQNAYNLDSTLVENQFALALTSSINGNFEQSIKLFNNIIETDSLAKVSAYGGLASVLRFQGKPHLVLHLAQKLSRSKYASVRREAYNIASVDAYYNDNIEEAITNIQQRIPLTKALYDSTLHRLDHPYWDYHLIGNILLAQGLPDSAKFYVDQGLALMDSGVDSRTRSVIDSDYIYFVSMYLFKKGRYQHAFDNFYEVFDENPNGFAGIWARILIAQDLPDSALIVLNRHARNGYFTSSLKGQAYQNLGNQTKAQAYFSEVLNYHQTGEWYWQQEYALIWKEVQRLIELPRQ